MKICLDCGSLKKSNKGEYCKSCGYKHRIRPTGLEYNIKVKNPSWFKKGDPKCGVKKGNIPWNIGKSTPAKVRRKISNTLKGRIPWNKNRPHYKIRGNKHPNWKGGVSSLVQIQYHSLEYKQWRKAVFERDNYTCQTCDKIKCYLEAHHVKERCNFPELIYNIDNGLTLCKDCHDLTKRGVST